MRAPGDPAPILRIDSSGPASRVTALAYSPDGNTLYAAGLDKVVHVWKRNAKGRYEYDRESTYRVPIGSDLEGMLTALAVSDDGQWVAVGGRGAKCGVAAERDEGGNALPAEGLSDDQWRDEGLIYVFHTGTRQATLLAGHKGAVQALKFAPPQAGKPQLLASGAFVWNAETRQAIAEFALWDVPNGTQIRRTPRFPQPGADGNAAWGPVPMVDATGRVQTGVRPTLAVAHIGPEPSAARVAIVWPHSRFGGRIWDVPSGRITYADPQHGTGRLWTTCTPTRDNPSVAWVTTARLPASSRLEDIVCDISLWRLPAAGQALPGAVSLEAPVASLAAGEFPFASAAVPRQTGSGNNAALAVVTARRLDEMTCEYQLNVIDAQGGNTPQKLWRQGMPLQNAYVAASSQGQIAACNEGGSEIVIYDVASRQITQRLTGSSLPIRTVAFVQKGAGDNAEHALLLRSRGAANPGDLPGAPARGDEIFRVDPAGITADVAGWSLERTSAKGWSAQVLPGTKSTDPQLAIAREGRPAGEIALHPGSSQPLTVVVTDFKIRGETEAHPVPLLIVACELNGEPKLYAYDLSSRERVGELLGHADRIHSLNISADGRFLATAGADATVRVWSIAELGAGGGTRGLLRDGDRILTVVDREGGPTVSAPFGGLAGDDVITGVDADGRRHTFKTAQEFNFFIWSRLPKSEISVVTARNAAGVRLRIGRAIEFKKPLFSLCFTSPTSGAKPEWIAWHPTGAFSSSGDAAEPSLGWHFNTGEPQAPVRYSSAREYREFYQTPDLLKLLFPETQKLPERQPPEAPGLSILLEDKGGQILDPDEQGEFLVRKADELKTLHVQAAGDSAIVPIRSVEWSRDADDDAEARWSPAEPSGPREWTVAAAPFDGTRGRFRYRFRLTTDEFPKPREVTAEVLVRLQPPAPEIELPGEIPARAEKPTVQIPVTVKTHGEETRISVRVVDHAGQNVAPPIEEVTREATFTFQPQLPLSRGFNRIEWRAAAVNALYGYESLEASSEQRNVEHVPPATLKIALESVTAGKELIPLASAPQPLPVRRPDIEFAGTIDAEGAPLEFAEVQVNDDPPRPLDGFQAGKATPLAFAQRLQLKPGVSTVVLRAGTQAGAKSEAKLSIEYSPPIPQVVRWSVDPPVLVEDAQGPATVQFTLQAEFAFAQDDVVDSFTASAIVDGTEQAAKQFISPGKTERWQATFERPNGPCKIRLELTNAAGHVEKTTDLSVAYRRPPRIVSLEKIPEKVSGSRLESLTVVVESPSGRPALLLRRNGELLDIPIELQEDGERWTAVVHDVPLQNGVNKLEVSARNDDGECRQPQRATVRAEGRPPVREVSVLEPVRDGMLPSNVLERVRILVRAEEKLEEITVLLNGEPFPVPASQLAEATRSEAKVFVLSPDFPLRHGPGNSLVVRIRDRAGAWSDYSQSVSCPPPPAAVILESLKTSSDVIRLEGDENAVSEARVPEAVATLRGRVEHCRVASPVQVWVNGFMQGVAELKPRGPAGTETYTFEALIVLNRKEANKVEVRSLGGPVDHSVSRRVLSLDCDKPETSQELNIVIMAPNSGGLSSKETDGIPKRILSALGATPKDQNDLDAGYKSEATAFSHITLRKRLGKLATRRYLISDIDRINHELRQRRSNLVTSDGTARQDRPVNGVVLVYFVGRERQVDSDEGQLFVLLTDGSVAVRNGQSGTDVNPEDITNRDVGRMMSSLHGAHLLFLDVRPENPQRVGEWPADPYLGVFRTVWNPDVPRNEPVLLSAFEQAQERKPMARALGDLEERIRTALAVPARQALVAGIYVHLPAELAAVPIAPLQASTPP